MAALGRRILLRAARMLRQVQTEYPRPVSSESANAGVDTAFVVVERALRQATRMEPRHRFVEHTGEIELVVEAPAFVSLLEEAARALADVMAEDAAGPASSTVEHVEIAANDRESLLVGWLNELVYRGDVHKKVYADVRINRASETKLEATIRGRIPGAPRTAVKAATWHRLRVAPKNGGLEAVVVLDV